MYDLHTPADLLREIGMHPKYKGYAYTLHALRHTHREPQCMYNLSKTLYPAVMEHFGVSYAGVERNIRFVIRRTWETGNREAIVRIFGAYSLDCVPTNAEFITVLTECMHSRRYKRRRSRV